jgi:hypothetical protein
VAALSVACASPTTPTPPPSPAPDPLPMAQPSGATLVYEETLTLTPVSPNAEVYHFGAILRNVGTSCASQISGMLHFRTAQNAIVFSRGWALDPSITVGLNEARPFSGCCVAYDELTTITNYVVDFSFLSVPCRG